MSQRYGCLVGNRCNLADGGRELNGPGVGCAGGELRSATGRKWRVTRREHRPETQLGNLNITTSPQFEGSMRSMRGDLTHRREVPEDKLSNFSQAQIGREGRGDTVSA